MKRYVLALSGLVFLILFLSIFLLFDLHPSSLYTEDFLILQEKNTNHRDLAWSARAVLSPGSPYQTRPSLEEMKALKAVRGNIPGVIIWSTLRHGTWQIYRMNADGTDPVRLTNDNEEYYHPVWSKDGQWIYFQRKKDIYRMLADGSDPQVVVKNGTAYDLVSGGKNLIYVRSEQDSHRIMLYDLETKSTGELLPRLLPQFAGKELMYPTLSPDGQWLAFASVYPNPWTIHMVKMNGTNLYAFADGCQPQYSPDGSRVVWITSGNHYLFIADPEGKEKRELVRHIPRRSHCYFPRWASNGKFVVFAASPHPNVELSDYEIFIKPIPAGEAVRLTFHPSSDIWPDIFIPQ